MATSITSPAASGAAASSSAAATSAAASSSSGGKEIAGNFQDFLLLLTTQLKNQSPLDPLDTNQFTQQLVQFAGVEQQLKGNDTLSSILSAMKSTSAANAASYVGLTVTADGSTASFASGGQASWTVNPAKAAAKATVSIKDANDKVVVTKATSLKAGQQTYTWDGKDADGNVQPAGDYKISFNALDASGQAVTVDTGISGKVSAVDVSGTSPVLTIGANTVPLSRVKTIAYQ